MDRHVFKTALMVMAALGLAFDMLLVAGEIANPGYCPVFLGMPACFLVLMAFLLVLASVFANPRIGVALFLAGSSTGLVMALWFSFGQITGTAQCPIILGMPMCYGSLVLFTLITMTGLGYLRE